MKNREVWASQLANQYETTGWSKQENAVVTEKQSLTENNRFEGGLFTLFNLYFFSESTNCSDYLTLNSGASRNAVKECLLQNSLNPKNN